MTYEEVKAVLTYNGRIPRNDRRGQPGRLTHLQRRQNDIIVLMYNETDVVAWWPCGRVRLNSGGHRTVTTKRRINEYAGVNVYQRRGVWWVNLPFAFENVLTPQLFRDGMEFRAGRWL